MASETEIKLQNLELVRDLELLPRLVTESHLTGIHSGENRGTDVEFAEHRQYEPGDDLRYLDWNALAKSDQLFLKQFESEAQINGEIVLDSSDSMSYNSGEISKWEFARALAVLLASILLQQQDNAQLRLAGETAAIELPRWDSIHELKGDLTEIKNQAAGGETTLLSKARELFEQTTTKSLWIFISDFWLPDGEAFFKLLQGLKRRGHDVLLFPIWDARERNFEVDQPVKIKDRETGEKLYLSPADQEEFSRALQTARKQLQEMAHKRGINFAPFFTDRSLIDQLRKYLNSLQQK